MTKRLAPWRGHKKTTTAVLVTLLERASRRDAVFSDDERALYTACEFWAAARHGTLREHLGCSALLRLRAAEVSFVGVGSPGVARILHDAWQQLIETERPSSLERVVYTIEGQLALLDEPVDQLIARFARAQRSLLIPTSRNTRTGAMTVVHMAR